MVLVMMRKYFLYYNISIGVHIYFNPTIHTWQILPLQDIQNSTNMSDLMEGFGQDVLFQIFSF